MRPRTGSAEDAVLWLAMCWKPTRDGNGTQVLEVRTGMCLGKECSGLEVFLAQPMQGSCELSWSLCRCEDVPGLLWL